jgi:hypothetical protein
VKRKGDSTARWDDDSGTEDLELTARRFSASAEEEVLHFPKATVWQALME